jgi:hypothetical protein
MPEAGRLQSINSAAIVAIDIVGDPAKLSGLAGGLNDVLVIESARNTWRWRPTGLGRARTHPGTQADPDQGKRRVARR